MKLNVPNTITILRILLTPVCIALFLINTIPHNQLIALTVFVLAISTDYVDGYLARKLNQVTNLGKFLDPLADKLIVCSMAILVAVSMTQTIIVALFAILIISRDLIIGGLRQVAALQGVVISADKTGKIKTVLQDITISVLIFITYITSGHVSVGVNVIFVFEIIAYVLIGVSLILTIASLINYFYKNKQVLS